MPPARVGEIRTPDWQQRALRVLLALGLEGLLLKTDLIEQMVQENLKWVPFTQLANLTGTPAMSVPTHLRSEEHTSELQSLMRISYAVFCLKKKKTNDINVQHMLH